MSAARLRAHPRAVILGCSGPALTDAERRFFRDADPLGFILFTRNCNDPSQIRSLVDELRSTVGRASAPVLIDQEGGRVVRLGPPKWPAWPPAARFGSLAEGDVRAGAEAARACARLIAAQLADLGIGVNCVPVLDVPQAGSDPVIGDRACGRSAQIAALIGGAICEGTLAGGVLPVIKHIPGHGRAVHDSHLALPRVEATLADLESVDFQPFRALAAMPWAMTAHVVYEAVDPERPATTSPAVVARIIRGAIGFDGLLVSDDLAMKALAEGPGPAAAAALAAGCDVVLHCSGRLEEMATVAAAVAPMSAAAWRRFEAGEAMRRAPEPLDGVSARARLGRLLGEEEGRA